MNQRALGWFLVAFGALWAIAVILVPGDQLFAATMAGATGSAGLVLLCEGEEE
mgnify:CR=1 FL=1